MSKEAALILGAVAALVNGIVVVAGVGGFDDGLQWRDLIPVAVPFLAALGIRSQVFSQDTVDGLTRPTNPKPNERGSTYTQGGRGPG